MYLKPIDPAPSQADANRSSGECVDVAVAWEVFASGSSGSSQVDRSSITPCRHYRRTRPSPNGGADLACQGELAVSGKGNVFNVGDLRRALAHPDVVESLRRSPVSFSDPNATTTIHLTVGEGHIHIVDGAGTGAPVPAGVAAAVQLLRGLDRAFENNDPLCARLTDRR